MARVRIVERTKGAMCILLLGYLAEAFIHRDEDHKRKVAWEKVKPRIRKVLIILGPIILISAIFV